MSGKTVAVSCFAVTLLISPSLSASDESRFRAGVFGGWSFFTAATERESFSESLNLGFLVGARFGFQVHPRLDLEAAYRYSPNGRLFFVLDDPFFSSVQLEAESDTGSHALGVDARYELTGGAWRPFVVGGIGLEHFGRKSTATRWNVGAGSLWAFGDSLNIRMDARYIVWTDFFDSDTTADSVEIYAGVDIPF